MTSLFEAAGMAPGPHSRKDVPGTPAEPAEDAPRPLADRLRPARLDEVIGQDHLLTDDAPIGRMAEEGRVVSSILWGPPGTGKTTIARLLAGVSGLRFEQLSAIFSGVADLRRVFDSARVRRAGGQGTLLFVDEIHRFNRAQQDGFLPHMEDGTIVLIGATTENPSFVLNPALLSRAQVLVLKRLDEPALEQLLARAEAAMDRPIPLDAPARSLLLTLADGDGRYLLNVAEDLLARADPAPLDQAGLLQAVQKRAPLYDKGQEAHYNLISALHKSVRGSDCDAALYYLARMLAGGEDPLYIARRMIRMASEDIGLADPQALHQALAAREAYEVLGSPEGELALAQGIVYLATAPKSNALYTAFGRALRSAKTTGSLMPPAHILNAPTKLMKSLGYGAGYVYDHGTEEGFSGQSYFPDDMARETFYTPTDRGQERAIAERLAAWTRLRTPENESPENESPAVDNPENDSPAHPARAETDRSPDDPGSA
ncbi:MAG: replication-associated recombination protein A [Alphaproteobacteria bacterium]